MRNDFSALLIFALLLSALTCFAIGCSEKEDSDDDELHTGDYAACQNEAQVDYWECEDQCKAQFANDSCGLTECIYGSDGCGIPYYTTAVECAENLSVDYNPYLAIDQCRLACELENAECVDANCAEDSGCEETYKACRGTC